MRLATFNVMHGRSLVDGRVDAARLASVVAGLDVDVLGLQEVDRGQARSGGVDLAAVAAEALGRGGVPAEVRFVPAVVGTPGGVFRAAVGEGDGAGGPLYGVALVSRWPVRGWRVWRLPAAPVRSPVFVPGPGGGLVLLRDEPRVVVAAVVEAPWGLVTVATTHLSFVPGWNVRQLRLAVAALRGLPGPRVLLGDLNLPAGVAGLVSGWRVLGRVATYPSPSPRVQLDHVLLDRRGAGGLVAGGVWAPSVPVSDHRPLVVELVRP